MRINIWGNRQKGIMNVQMSQLQIEELATSCPQVTSHCLQHDRASLAPASGIRRCRGLLMKEALVGGPSQMFINQLYLALFSSEIFVDYKSNSSPKI